MICKSLNHVSDVWQQIGALTNEIYHFIIIKGLFLSLLKDLIFNIKIVKIIKIFLI